MRFKYTYDIWLDGVIVGESGDMLFNSAEEATADAQLCIRCYLSKEYDCPLESFEIKHYRTLA